MSALTFTLNDGHKIPWLGFGTGTAWYKKDAEAAVSLALKNGIKHLDGAQGYGNEDSLGAAIAASGEPRESLFVTTKLGPVPAGKTVKDTLVESLKKLKLNYVDLFLIHVPTQHPDLKDVWKQMEGIHKDGLAKSIGVSNFRIKDFEQILDGATIVPAVNQIEYHPYISKACIPVMDYMKKHGITVASYAGLAPLTRFKEGPVDPVLKEVAARVGSTAGTTVTESQVLQLWLREKGIVAVTTSTKESRIREYLAGETLPKLTEEEVKAIDEAGSKVHHRAFFDPKMAPTDGTKDEYSQ